MQKSATNTKGTALGRTSGRTEKRASPAPAKNTTTAQASCVPATMTEIAAAKSSKRFAKGSGYLAGFIALENQTGWHQAKPTANNAIESDVAGKISRPPAQSFQTSRRKNVTAAASAAPTARRAHVLGSGTTVKSLARI